MSPNDSPRIPFDVAATLPKYPGQFPPEVPILRKWITLHQGDFDAIQFNVRVGSGYDPGPTFLDADRAGAIANTQYRIDAVAWKGNQATLIEVKRYAGAGALGQLATYSHLWQKVNPGLPAPVLVVVTSSTQPDMPEVLAVAGVGLEVVTP